MPEYPASVRLYTNQFAIRCLGTLAGIGFVAIGAYAMLGGDDTVSAHALERAWWFGVTALIGGIWAIGVSWLDPDLSGVWCRQPRRFR
ncbi:MAG: hypothetical protein OEW90_13800 [Betaproteobacteria bacterium]|nr:hypothetical protein [Betaproteobacteria bacterium]